MRKENRLKNVRLLGIKDDDKEEEFQQKRQKKKRGKVVNKPEMEEN